MSDNTTAYAAKDYEYEVRRTIPFHSVILDLAIEVARTIQPNPKRWLDTGCGPGRLVERARAKCINTDFILADPSDGMLNIAREVHHDLNESNFIAASSQSLPELEPFDVITAIQCHHYGDHTARKQALIRCRDLLTRKGVLIVFENVYAKTEQGHEWQRARWVQWQEQAGREHAKIEEALIREGTKFFPIRVSEHFALFETIGFKPVELIWRAYGQAGFLAVCE